MQVLRVNDEIINAEDFVKLLKLDNAFENLAEKIVVDKLTVHVAKKSGIEVSDTEINERVNDFRRLMGLHRAEDTRRYIDDLGITVDDLETHIRERIYRDKMRAKIANPDAIADYFRMHSPKFDALEIGHIMIESEPKAKELMSVLSDDPESFGEYAREHSLDAETKAQGGFIGKILRGSLAPSIEAKLFNAEAGEPIGPFPGKVENIFEIFQVGKRFPATLDEATTAKIEKVICDEWLQARADEHILEIA